MATEKKVLKQHAEECCKLANERYGLTRGMQMLMRNLNMTNEDKNKLIELARNRNFEAVEIILNSVDVIGG